LLKPETANKTKQSQRYEAAPPVSAGARAMGFLRWMKVEQAARISQCWVWVQGPCLALAKGRNDAAHMVLWHSGPVYTRSAHQLDSPMHDRPPP